MPDRQVAAAELRRVVRPGGRCIVVTNGEGNLARMCALVEGAAGGGWRWERPAETELAALTAGSATEIRRPGWTMPPGTSSCYFRPAAAQAAAYSAVQICSTV